MTDRTDPGPRPYTDDELRHARHIVTTGVAMPPSLPGRLLATVDRWREAHNQVAAERDALRAAMRTALNPDTKINDAWRLLAEHVGWHDAPVSGTPGEDEYGEGVAEFVMRGTPGEDTAPATDGYVDPNGEPNPSFVRTAPAEPVCTTCNGSGPYCRPVGDLPGDTP